MGSEEGSRDHERFRLDTTVLKDAERVARVTMIVILLTAGTSKFFSHGGFFEYYSTLFQGDLRISLPPFLVDSYLKIVPFIEVGLAFVLISNRYKRCAVYGWFGFMLSLLVGHYILQEWASVNQLIDYIFLGLLTMLLPSHQSWLQRDRKSAVLSMNLLEQSSVGTKSVLTTCDTI